MQRVYRIATMFKDGLPQRFKVLRGNLSVLRSVLELHAEDAVFQERHASLIEVFGGDNFLDLMSLTDADCTKAWATKNESLVCLWYTNFYRLETLLQDYSDEVLAAMQYPWLDSEDAVCYNENHELS